MHGIFSGIALKLLTFVKKKSPENISEFRLWSQTTPVMPRNFFAKMGFPCEKPGE
jgi:hypothetical protein